MNTEERNALVESLEAALDTAYGLRWNVDPRGVAMTVMPIIDRLLAERSEPTVPEAATDREERMYFLGWRDGSRSTGTGPTAAVLTEREPTTTVPLDAERVEAGAIEIWKNFSDSPAGSRWEDLLKNYGKDGVLGQAYYRDIARVVLEAAGPEPDWLDEALNSVHPGCYIDGMKHFDGEWAVWLMWPTLMDCPIRGTGSTPTAAVLNAIAAAKQEGAGDE